MMGRVVRFGALVMAGAMALSGVAFVATAQAAPQLEQLDLGEGYKFLLIGAGDSPARVGNPKVIFINVALNDAKMFADRAKLLEASDRMFESVLLGAAEKGYYRRATVNIRRPGTAIFEDFLYLRGDNDVWLRQAGKESWKTAQDSKWTPPAVEKIEVAGMGAFHVEVAVEITPPEGFARAVQLDFVTKTPVTDIQRKYQEIKALWSRVDRDKMRAEGFDLVLVGNFAEPQRGRFHARRGFYVRIPRDTNGPWPELPDRAPEDRNTLISKNDVTSGGEASKLVGNNFAASDQQMRLTQVMTGPLTDATRLNPTARIGFGEALPGIKLNLDPFVVRIR
jgi:hypothetical protein